MKGWVRGMIGEMMGDLLGLPGLHKDWSESIQVLVPDIFFFTLEGWGNVGWGKPTPPPSFWFWSGMQDFRDRKITGLFWDEREC